MHPGGQGTRIHPNAAHQRQVQHQSVVTRGSARNAVAAATHRQQQVVRAGEVDRRDDIGGAAAVSDQGWPLVHDAIPEEAALVVARISWADQAASQIGRECLYSLLV